MTKNIRLIFIIYLHENALQRQGNRLWMHVFGSWHLIDCLAKRARVVKWLQRKTTKGLRVDRKILSYKYNNMDSRTSPRHELWRELKMLRTDIIRQKKEHSHARCILARTHECLVRVRGVYMRCSSANIFEWAERCHANMRASESCLKYLKNLVFTCSSELR